MIRSDTLDPSRYGTHLGTGAQYMYCVAILGWQRLLVTPNIYAFLETESPNFFSWVFMIKFYPLKPKQSLISNSQEIFLK